MSRDVVDRILNSVDSIGSVLFTGGEPTLNVSIIRYFVQQVIRRKISISSFYVVTNGKIQSISLMKILIDLYAYCYEKEMCGLEVSGDQYHDLCDTPLYEAFRFYDKDARKMVIRTEGIINEGRAKENNIGYRDVEIPKFDVVTGLGVTQVLNLVYIASNGNVTSECDLSYERMDKEAFGNILKEDLSDIIIRNMKED